MTIRRLPRLLLAAALTSGLVSAASTAHAGPLDATAVGPVFSVDCSLSTDGDGSTATPWNTLADVAVHSARSG